MTFRFPADKWLGTKHTHDGSCEVRARTGGTVPKWVRLVQTGEILCTPEEEYKGNKKVSKTIRKRTIYQEGILYNTDCVCSRTATSLPGSGSTNTETKHKVKNQAVIQSQKSILWDYFLSFSFGAMTRIFLTLFFALFWLDYLCLLKPKTCHIIIKLKIGIHKFQQQCWIPTTLIGLSFAAEAWDMPHCHCVEVRNPNFQQQCRTPQWKISFNIVD